MLQEHYCKQSYSSLFNSSIMEFGANAIFVDLFEDEENVYRDELVDGIASCAQEQTEAWQV